MSRTTRRTRVRTTLLHVLSLLSVLGGVCASECKMRALVAPRRPEPFGHGINIKGRVNIVNNLRYNGPSGVDDKFVDMRWKGGRGANRKRERDRRETTATRLATLRGGRLHGEKEREEDGKREMRLFVDIINHRSGVGTSLRATVTRRVRPARKFVDMQSSFSLPSLPLLRLFLDTATGLFASSLFSLSHSLLFRALGSTTNKFAGKRRQRYPNFRD